MKFKHTLCFLLLLFFAAIVPDAQAQPRNPASNSGASNRIALVIGNDSYRHIPTLRNARADARAIGAALTKSGFAATVLVDADEKAMRAALRAFKSRISGGDEAVFFFSGHGVQLRGVNYLLPIDLRGDSEDQVRDDAVSLQQVLDDLQDQKARFSLAIIDACRDNPFRQAGRAIGGRGLATTSPANGQMVIYSAGTGQQALDRLNDNDKNPNGLFTRVFLKEIERSGLPVDQVLFEVREEVARLAKVNGHDQVPALYNQALGRFYFRPGNATLAVPAAPQADPRADDRALWESVKDSSNAAELQAYLDQFPNGIFAGVVRARMKALTTPKPPVQVAVAPPTTAPAITLPATTLAASAQTPGTVFRDCDVCPQMVVIPAGAYTMGANDIRDYEKPPHPVTIPRPFAAGKFEVTFDEWDACVRERGCSHNPGDLSWGRSSRPVINVSWADAKQYAQWLSLKAGRQYRLLSEAEWEYVARAGTTTPFNTGVNINPAQANYDAADSFAGSVTGVARKQTIAVGSYPSNAFGLHDVHGNVWEWTEDCWNANHNGAPDDGTARTSGDCGQRVVRGGSWLNYPHDLRSAVRIRFTPGNRYDSLGLRVARTF